MEHLIIQGGHPLMGRVPIEGAKNAALPACVASLLTDEPIVLHRIPHLRDVETILATIRSLGKDVAHDGETVTITSARPLCERAEPLYVKQMRASFLILGPLLARLGQAIVPLPGGCRIGARPVDLHLQGLRLLNARTEERGETVTVVTEGLRGTRIRLPYPSVGATEQLVMAATLADGETGIENPALEPEIFDLIDLLTKMGAQVSSEDGTIRIVGRRILHGAEHTIIPDRMEAGTYLLAGAITRGDIEVEGVIPGHLRSLLSALEESGMEIAEEEDTIRLSSDSSPRPLCITTAPYPGFPTDFHPLLAAFLALGAGTSRIEETVFEHRFGYVLPLNRMGASIAIEGSTAVIAGTSLLKGVEVDAPDIRAGAALVLAALVASGETTIDHPEHIDRGYAKIESKLRLLGAEIERTC
ncbi:MAG: UDP-N-acetylglucosamine 1-carboxyvinyltransferase [Candidatus Bipolaricaulota bacterium]|nr:UDP-N-acetylglucosamine 1-carboxyvinyltransferase [Candidatus Bipolaricaulota bacterium]